MANVRLPCDSVAAGALPVPLNPTACGLPGALSVTDKLADRVPPPNGENVTEMVQLDPVARVAGLIGQSELWPKSLAFAPAMPTLEIVKAAVPELVNFTDCAALVDPNDAAANDKLPGAIDTAAAGAMPVPLSPTL